MIISLGDGHFNPMKFALLWPYARPVARVRRRALHRVQRVFKPQAT